MTEEEIEQEAKRRAEALMSLKAKPGEGATWEKKAIFKFNGGLGALLCSRCKVIIKTAIDFSPIERHAFWGSGHGDFLGPQFCDSCKEKFANPDSID